MEKRERVLCSQFYWLICGIVTAFLSDDQREKIQTYIVSHWCSVWKKIYGVELEDALADEDKEDEEEDELHDDFGTFGADEQLEVMCDELHDNLGGFMDDDSFSCACC